MAINKFERDVRKKYIGGPEIVDFFEQKSDYREVARDAARLGLERVYFVASHEGDVPEFVRTLENPRGYSKKCLYWSLQTARKETVYPLLEEAVRAGDANGKHVCFIEIDIFDRRIVDLVDRNGVSVLR